ncbi:MAG: DUF4365 domain-containing protein [Gemmatimonadaceae bacterium]|nr:DUF4365 domain-containing protein [Gemmatimonadaceae bacterium]
MDKVRLPKLGNTRVELRGENEVSSIAARSTSEGGLGAIYRPYSHPDFGVDAHLEFVDELSSEVTGRLLALQIKAGASYFKRKHREGWLLGVKESQAAYWRNYSVPVVVVLVDLKRRRSFWADARFTIQSSRGKHDILVRSSSVFDASSAKELRNLASESPSDFASELRNEFSEAVARELQLQREIWREGRVSETSEWLRIALAASDRGDLSPSVSARIYKFAAATALEGREDSVGAARHIEVAKSLDPHGDHAAAVAAHLLHLSDAQAAVSAAAEGDSAQARTLLASLHLSLGNLDLASRALEGVEAQSRCDVADLARVRMLLAFARRDWGRVDELREELQQVAPRFLEVQYVCARVDYFLALPADVRPSQLVDWPYPLSQESLLCEPEARTRMQRAGNAFAELRRREASLLDRRKLEAWAVAVLYLSSVRKAETVELVQSLLEGDKWNPFVLLWASAIQIECDYDEALDAIASEVVGGRQAAEAHIYMNLCASRRDSTRLEEAIRRWAHLLAQVFGEAYVTYWRARQLLLAGDVDAALREAATLPSVSAFSIQVLAAIESHPGRQDAGALADRLENIFNASGEIDHLVLACRAFADAGLWNRIPAHAPRVLEARPTLSEYELVASSYFHCNNYSRCIDVLELALRSAGSDSQPRLRRMNAVARLRIGDPTGAVRDWRVVIGSNPDAGDTADLVALAKALMYLGDATGIAAVAKVVVGRGDLTAVDALGLASLTLHDNRNAARRLWEHAIKAGVSDELVPAAYSLSFQLGLEDSASELATRMVRLAASGSAYVKSLSLDDLQELQARSENDKEHARREYHVGNIATHHFARVSGVGMGVLYHFLPEATREQGRPLAGPPLYFRSGTRGPGQSIDLEGRKARVALDLSSLILLEHLGLLKALVEVQRPVFLSVHSMLALREIRDGLRSPQPSYVETLREANSAIRRNLIRTVASRRPVSDHAGRGNEARSGVSSGAVRATGADLAVFAAKNGGAACSEADSAVQYSDRTLDVEEFLLLLGERNSQAVAPSAVSVMGSSIPSGATIAVLHEAAIRVLESGNLLGLANRYSLSVESAFVEWLREQLDSHDAAEARFRWVDSLIDRVTEGIARGDFRFLSPPQSTNAPGGPLNAAPGAQSKPGRELRTSKAAERRTSVVDGVHQEERAGPHKADAGEGGAAIPKVGDGAAGETHLGSTIVDAPLELKILAELFRYAPHTVDVVAVDDRWVNRHHSIGAARVVDALDIVETLRANASISNAEAWTAIGKLRAANARYVPLSVEELLDALRAAPVRDGVLEETADLARMREYYSGILRDHTVLTVPSPNDASSIGLGELEVIRGFATAIRECLVALWLDEVRPGDVSEVNDCQARGDWVLDNLAVNLGLLRSLVSKVPVEGELGVSAFDIASLVFSSFRLVASEINDDRRTEMRRSAVFVRWVVGRLGRRRAEYDREFRDRFVASLVEFFVDWEELRSEDSEKHAVAVLLARRVIDALPDDLRDAVTAEDQVRSLLELRTIETIELREWSFELGEFASALQQLYVRNAEPARTGRRRANGAASQSVGLRALPGSPEDSCMLRLVDVTTIALVAGSRAVELTIRDALFPLVEPTVLSGQKAVRALEESLGVDRAWAKHLLDQLTSRNDPHERMRMIGDMRRTSRRARLEKISDRWKESGRVTQSDLFPVRFLSTESADQWLAPKYERHDGSSAAGAENVGELSGGDESLLEEFSRLCVSHAFIPESFLERASAASPVQREHLVRGSIRRPRTPLGALHLLRLVVSLGDYENRYARLARMWFTKAARGDLEQQIGLFVALARICAKVRDFGQVFAGDQLASAVADPSSGTPTGGCACRDAILHANELVGLLGQARVDFDGFSQWLRVVESNLPAFPVEPRRLAHRCEVVDGRYTSRKALIAALQYVTAGARWAVPSRDGGDLSFDSRSFSSLVIEGFDVALSGTDCYCSGCAASVLAVRREKDQGLRLLGSEIFFAKSSSHAVFAQVQERFRESLFDLEAWLGLDLYCGSNPCPASMRSHFESLLQPENLSMLLDRHPQFSSVVATRLCEAYWGSDEIERLRRAVVEVARETRTPDERRDRWRRSSNSRLLGAKDLALLTAVVALAQGESSASSSIARFSEDVRLLGVGSPDFLVACRPIVEEIVRDRSLVEARAALELLLECRSEGALLRE